MGVEARPARPLRRALLALALGVLVWVPAQLVMAGGGITLTGELDYDPISNVADVETITRNVVELQFDPAGGPFSGSANLELAHLVQDKCEFNSAHAWTFGGTYDPVTHQFAGTFIETLEQTTGACEGVTYSRTFDPDEGEFKGSIITRIGRLQSIIPPVKFTMMVDPALVGGGDRSIPPGGSTTSSGPPTTTTTPETNPPTVGPTTNAGSGPTTPDAAASDLLVPAIAIVLAILILLVVLRWLRRGPRGPGAPPTSTPESEDVDPCADAERRWREAQGPCDEATRHADELSNQYDDLESSLKRRRAERASLPSEETRVELPDGTSLSQLDLELRRTAARGAWDAYLSNPSAESAAAAESAWQQQATPEWLADQRRQYETRKAELDRDIAANETEFEQTQRSLAEAREQQRAACDAAAEARRLLDKCLDAQQQPVGAAAANEPTPPPAPAPPTPNEPIPPPAPAPPAVPPAGTRAQEDEGPCPEGAQRWVEFDGPHPFDILEGSVIRIDRLAIIGGSTRTDRLGSIDAGPASVPGPNGRTIGFDDGALAAMTADEFRAMFTGEGGLDGIWGPAGSGANQELYLIVSYDVRSASAYCDRREICVEGRWEPRRQWRARFDGPITRRTANLRVSGNFEAGRGRTEEDYVGEIVAFFVALQAAIEPLMERRQAMERYLRACRAGERDG